MPDSSELCSDCGICCDGSLFSSVSLDAAGLTAARDHRLPMVETSDGFRLELPCPALRGVLCEIYEERPSCCAEYSCELLTQVDEGELSFDDARSIIEALREVRSRQVEAVGTTPWWTAQRAVTEARRSSPTWAADHPAIVADLLEIETLVRRHFWG